MTVQEMIEELNKVEDKSRGITLYASTGDPAIPGILEIFGYVYDVDAEVLKSDKECTDVVISSTAEVQVSQGYHCCEECRNE